MNLFSKNAIVFILLLTIVKIGICQSSSSENGYHISPHGNLNVLLVFAEVVYDDVSKDPYPNGSKDWKKGSLPTWKDDVFDPFHGEIKKSKMTRYFDFMSLGNFGVYGDYLEDVIQVKASDINNLSSRNQVQNAIVEKLNTYPFNQTYHGLSPEHFDQWDYSGGVGSLKKNESNGAYDHVMIIVRNSSAFGNGAGYVTKSSVVKVNGKSSDTFSMFGGGSSHPFNILRHEFSHLLFGGNNFHCGGGQHRSGGYNYFIPFQAGWSMLGGYLSSLMTCNGLDRYRLGWSTNSEHLIKALNEKREEVNSDLILKNEMDTSVFILRDFVTKGDAVRIKLPFISEGLFEQWLWLEFHQTFANNGCEFDQFMYEEEYECRPGAVPGLYAYVQVDKNDKTGPLKFSGYGDYLRFLPADGYYDYVFEDTLLQNNWCVNNAKYHPFIKKKSHENPLSGNGDLEEIPYDEDGNGKIGKTEARKVVVEKRLGSYYFEMAKFGHYRHVFSASGNNVIDMGSNPSSASMITCVSNDKAKFEIKNNQEIVLNGVKVEILSQTKDEMVVRVISNDVKISKNVVWRGDQIRLPQINGEEGYSLIIEKGKQIELARSKTPSRVDNPQPFEGQQLFTDTTKMVFDDGVAIWLKNRSKLVLKEGSQLYLKNTSVRFGWLSKIVVKEGSSIYVSRQNKNRLKVKLKGGQIIYTD